MEKEWRRLLWKAYKLNLFAPWEGVKLSERVVVLSALIVINGFVAPFSRWFEKRVYREICGRQKMSCTSLEVLEDVAWQAVECFVPHQDVTTENHIHIALCCGWATIN